jgi:AcrR family transcriptional regulator
VDSHPDASLRKDVVDNSDNTDNIDIVAIETKSRPRHAAVIDGRTARRSRNKDAVLDALIELAHEGQEEPAIEAIADRAGVSYRSVYRYFDDRTELMLAAIGRLMGDVWSWLDPAAVISGTFEERLTGFIDQRVQIYRKLAPLARTAVRRRMHEPVVAEHYDRIGVLFRERLAAQFEPELAAMSGAERALALASLEVCFQFEALEHLVRHHAMTDLQLEQVLGRQVRTQLGPCAMPVS